MLVRSNAIPLLARVIRQLTGVDLAMTVPVPTSVRQPKNPAIFRGLPRSRWTFISRQAKPIDDVRSEGTTLHDME